MLNKKLHKPCVDEEYSADASARDVAYNRRADTKPSTYSSWLENKQIPN